MLYGRNDQQRVPQKKTKKAMLSCTFSATITLVNELYDCFRHETNMWEYIRRLGSGSLHFQVIFVYLSRHAQRRQHLNLYVRYAALSWALPTSHAFTSAIGLARQVFIQIAIANHRDCRLNVSGLE